MQIATSTTCPFCLLNNSLSSCFCLIPCLFVLCNDHKEYENERRKKQNEKLYYIFVCLPFYSVLCSTIEIDLLLDSINQGIGKKVERNEAN